MSSISSSCTSAGYCEVWYIGYLSPNMHILRSSAVVRSTAETRSLYLAAGHLNTPAILKVTNNGH